ncbi:MAG TPA: hypothetical protein VIA18_29550, partial [Polyangia bacterium]|nr:hypothetical protein [Polyangia bacterium]
QAMVKTVSLGGQIGRALAFSPDGLKMYVLTGGTTLDPCSPGTTAPANSIVVLDTDGTVGSTFTLPGFASDLTVDPATGTLVLADATSGQIATLDVADAAAGTVAPAVLLGGLTCPSAVRVVDGVVFAVTSTRDLTQTNAFVLQRVTLSSGASTALSFAGPSYPIPIDSGASANGDIQPVNIPVRPASIEAYELAMTPDGNRAEFAIRAHYIESGTQFELSQLPCTVQLDVVEYGLYAVDVRTGNASYTSRSQAVQGPATCIDCTDGLGDESKGDCPPSPGDRPAGLAAAFGP